MAMYPKRGIVLASLVLGLGLLLGVSDAFAQGKHSHKKKSADSSAVATHVSDSSAIAKTEIEHQPEEEQPFVLEPWEAAREHLHNKLIHLPVGFALAAFVVSLASLRRKELQPAVLVLVLVAAAGSVAAYFTGVAQAHPFQGGPEQWVVDLHRWLGISTGLSLWVWAAFLVMRPLQRFAFIAGCAVVLLVLVTGFFGGILAHA